MRHKNLFIIFIVYEQEEGTALEGVCLKKDVSKSADTYFISL